ncbi:MAG: TIGR01777 family oxidoreductase [Mycobacteriales bacterium]
MKVVIAGGSGSLGRRVAADLAARGDEVVVLTRTPSGATPYREVAWDGRTVGAWAGELAGAAVINVCGDLVDRRPTAANIELLTRSRVEPTRALVDAAWGLDVAPAVWIQMSTLAIYGDAGEAILTESAAPADGPPQMAGVARDWEAAASAVIVKRKIVLRTGIVLDPGTPAFSRLQGIVKWGLGGRIGTGRQWTSWVHVADFVALIRHCIDRPTMAGVVHATSPCPVPNAQLMAAFRRALRRPLAPPTPAFLVHAGAVLLRTDPALALTGRRAVPAKLLGDGFQFLHPHIEEALDDLLSPAHPGANH